jgi:hypothetical protein
LILRLFESWKKLVQSDVVEVDRLPKRLNPNGTVAKFTPEENNNKLPDDRRAQIFSNRTMAI